MRYGEVKHAVERKVPGPRRGAKETNFWAEIDGRRVLRVTVPKKHPGDMKRLTLKSIREQLRLNDDQFSDFVHCRLSATDYERHLRAVMGEGGQ